MGRGTAASHLCVSWLMLHVVGLFTSSLNSIITDQDGHPESVHCYARHSCLICSHPYPHVAMVGQLAQRCVTSCANLNIFYLSRPLNESNVFPLRYFIIYRWTLHAAEYIFYLSRPLNESNVFVHLLLDIIISRWTLPYSWRHLLLVSPPQQIQRLRSPYYCYF